jgi:hypothetical protein
MFEYKKTQSLKYNIKGHFINLICCKFMKPKPMDKFGKTLLNLAKIT